jgi:hypothetical protein
MAATRNINDVLTLAKLREAVDELKKARSTQPPEDDEVLVVLPRDVAERWCEDLGIKLEIEEWKP